MEEFFKVVDSNEVTIPENNVMCFGTDSKGKNYTIIKTHEHNDKAKTDANRACELLNLFHNGKIKYIF